MLTLAQKLLNDLKSGIQIRSLQCVAHVPPLQTRAAFTEVTQAEQERSAMKSNAEKEATATKLQAAGENWKPLIDAIAVCDRTVRESDQQAAAAAYGQVDTLLLSEDTGGNARRIVEDAKSQARQTVSHARALASRYNDLLPKFLANPDLTIHWEWMATKQDILSRQACIKQYSTNPGMGFVLFLNYDPQLIKKLKEADARKLEDELNEKKKEEARRAWGM